MEDPVKSARELVILYTIEAEEWATYLQQILKSSRKFRRRSILLHTVHPADGYDFGHFQSCACIVLLITGAMLDLLYDPDLQGALHSLLRPPLSVVVLLCGVPEDDMLIECFQDWSSWRKLYADDEPAVYVSTILESITDSRRAEAEQESKSAAESESPNTQEVMSEHQDAVLKDEEEATSGNSTSEQHCEAPSRLTCLTVQPNRVLCGKRERLFIILTNKVDEQKVPEVEFSSDHAAAERVPGTVENEYTISVSVPDMPAGEVSLTLYTNQSCLSLTPLIYYTNMGEINRCLENATDPVNFICQAFNLTSNATESLDKMLTDSLKSRMPATSLQLFGIRQIEKDNMSSYQRNEELPTLLHFAAKYGLKKLTTVLLQCPGALQAYSVMNKSGDYPNTLAEKSGFSDLRQFMDEFVETADMLKSHIEGSIIPEDDYEMMLTTPQDMMLKYCSEDIYESMLGINPECADDLYVAMNSVDENPEEVMLRKFFQTKPCSAINQDDKEHLKNEDEEKDNHDDFDQIEVEEDPYNLCPDDIYDTVDDESTYNPAVLNRPPAPIPRPESMCDPEKPSAYISQVFTDKVTSQSATVQTGYPEDQPEEDALTPIYDPYAGMKTPGQRQLISLQERVKVGEISVDEAVQEFKAWQLDHERRSSSIRYQQENLKKLRESITRRHKERGKGKDQVCEISAPLQRNAGWSSSMTLECSVYESMPRVVAPPPPPPPVTQIIQRGSWKTGSTSSTSSTESNRLSTHSTFSYSSGTEPDFEDAVENLPPPRPPRSSEAPQLTSPPRIPPRIPERATEKMLHERYISCPTRALPQRPTQRHMDSAPPVPRRLR